jgi:hypothetical protein
MPNSTTRPRGRVMRRQSVIDAALPTASIVAWAPLVR